ncbi:16S rRNA methyltransferase [Archaeoglobus sp.]
MLRIVFVESSLETVPKSIAKHPAILSDAKRRKKKPTEMILDDSKHHTAIKNLENREKRGRPDIIHQCLLLSLDSPIEDLEVYVHTVNDVMIWINRKTRLPRNYNRFIGLIEDLFKKREIKAKGETLLKIVDSNLEEILKGFRVVVMSEKGERKDVELEGCAVCIGAFPHGDFDERTMNVFRKVDATFISVADKPVTALYTTCWVLSMCKR